MTDVCANPEVKLATLLCVCAKIPQSNILAQPTDGHGSERPPNERQASISMVTPNNKGGAPVAIAAAVLLFILASPEGVVSAYSFNRPSGILGRGLPQQRRPDPTATTHPHGAIARRPHDARRFLGSWMSNSGNDGGFVPPVHEKEDEEAAFIKSTLLSNFVFQGLPKNILDKLVLAFDRVELPPSSTIIEQGDKNIDYFYVIRDGEVSVIIDGEVLPGKYGTMSEGTMFGELAMVYSMPRKATISTKTDCTLYRVDRQTFRYFQRLGQE